MMCSYNWTIEYYSVLSKACLDCEFNHTSCNNPDCVAANGMKRAIVVINRMLPGPQINVCKDDTINVYLFNNLHDNEVTSIHWY